MFEHDFVGALHTISGFGIALTLVALSATFYLSDYPAETKRYWHPYIASILTAAFLALILASGCPIASLTFIVPGAVLICLANVRNVIFCDDCAHVIYRRAETREHELIRCKRCRHISHS